MRFADPVASEPDRVLVHMDLAVWKTLDGDADDEWPVMQTVANIRQCDLEGCNDAEIAGSCMIPRIDLEQAMVLLGLNDLADGSAADLHPVSCRLAFHQKSAKAGSDH